MRKIAKRLEDINYNNQLTVTKKSVFEPVFSDFNNKWRTGLITKQGTWLSIALLTRVRKSHYERRV